VWMVKYCLFGDTWAPRAVATVIPRSAATRDLLFRSVRRERSTTLGSKRKPGRFGVGGWGGEADTHCIHRDVCRPRHLTNKTQMTLKKQRAQDFAVAFRTASSASFCAICVRRQACDANWVLSYRKSRSFATLRMTTATASPTSGSTPPAPRRCPGHNEPGTPACASRLPVRG